LRIIQSVWARLGGEISNNFGMLLQLSAANAFDDAKLAKAATAGPNDILR
jgi:hypothetical protein